MTVVADPVDEAQAEQDRIDAEILHLEAQIATATWDAAKRESEGADATERDAIYARLALWRTRHGALLVAKRESARKVAHIQSDEAAAADAVVRAALQLTVDSRTESLEAAVTAAKAYAKSLRDVVQAETARRLAFDRASPGRVSASGLQAMQSAKAVLPPLPAYSEPLFDAVLAAALTPVGERPFWRTRADHLAKQSEPI